MPMQKHFWPQLFRPKTQQGRRLADANKEKVKITGKPEVMSPRTFQITDKEPNKNRNFVRDVSTFPVGELRMFTFVENFYAQFFDIERKQEEAGDKTRANMIWYRYCKVIMYII